MPRRRSIKLGKNPAMTVTRDALTGEKLVYIASSPRRSKYRFGGRSSIVYIGTTKAGVQRVAQSASVLAKRFLGSHGVSKLEFYVVHCAPLQKVQTWRQLERGLLITFREQYGDVPLGNTKGKKMSWTGEESYFSKERLRAIIAEFDG